MTHPSRSEAADVLHRIVERLAHGNTRPGQLQLAAAVERHLQERTHLVARAGTGTGKTLAYLVPALLSGKTVVIATSTLALLEQLDRIDMPLLREQYVAVTGDPTAVTWSTFKGRSNYLCLQRLSENDPENGRSEGTRYAELYETEPRSKSGGEVERILAWARGTANGDRSELGWEPSPEAWSTVSVTGDECPGRSRCPKADQCYAELAREQAREARIVLTTHAMYALDVLGGRKLLPPHQIVVIDECHDFADTVSEAAGCEITPGRFNYLSRRVARIDDELSHRLETMARRWDAQLRPYSGRAVNPSSAGDLGETMEAAQVLLAALGEHLAMLEDPAPSVARIERATQQLSEHLDRVQRQKPGHVTWVEKRPTGHALKLAAVDPSGELAAKLWPDVVAVLTSATITPGFATTIGLPETETETLDVGDAFSFETNSLLYIPTDLPDPRTEKAHGAQIAEMVRLIKAAGGRALVLCTSAKAMELAGAALRAKLRTPVLVQGEQSRGALLSTFRDDTRSSLVATASFWTGVDIPGDSCVLVIIDKIPFPRPDDPLMEARRELHGPNAFMAVDVSHAAVKLAQGAGRLLRRSDDRGVVAVLDPRLLTARYGAVLRASMPPMPVSSDSAEVVELLKSLHTPVTRAPRAKQPLKAKSRKPTKASTPVQKTTARKPVKPAEKKARRPEKPRNETG